MAVPSDAGRVEQALSAFSLFTPDGLLARAVRDARSRVTLLYGEHGEKEVDIVTVEATREDGAERWILYADRKSRLVLSAEYKRDRVAEGILRPSATVTLDYFEYNQGLPDALFQLPPIRTGR